MIRNRIAVKLGLTIIALFLIVLMPLGYATSSIFASFYVNELERNMEHLSLRYADMIGRGGGMTAGMIGMMAEMNGTDVIIFAPDGTAVLETNVNNPPVPAFLSPEDAKQLSQNKVLHKKMVNEAGERFLITVRPLPGEASDGALGIVATIEPAMKAVEQIQSLLILAGIGAVLIAVGITYIISRRLSQPLLQMEVAARRMSHGDLDVKVEVLSNDEVGSLAQTINGLGDELKRYRDTRSEFFANVSHELRTPITYLEGYSQVLADGLIATEEEKRKYLLIIHQEARRMKGLVEDLFELAKMEEGKININMNLVNLSEVLQHVLNKAGPRVREKGLKLEQRIAPGISYVMGDRERMEQIMFNLLDNAVRYTTAGTIRAEMYVDGANLAIKLADTGAGIPKEELPFIFERFYRVEKSRSREFGGSGLGLAIVKSLVEMQNGHIEVKSDVGQGTEFLLTFPIVSEGGQS